MALSVSTPKHLRVIGLLEDGPDDLESNINQQYKMVCLIKFKVAFNYTRFIIVF